MFARVEIRPSALVTATATIHRWPAVVTYPRLASVAGASVTGDVGGVPESPSITPTRRKGPLKNDREAFRGLPWKINIAASSSFAQSSLLVNVICRPLMPLVAAVGVVKSPLLKTVGASSMTVRVELNFVIAWPRGIWLALYHCWPLKVLESPSVSTTGVFVPYRFHAARCAAVSTDVHLVTICVKAALTAIWNAVLGLTGIARALRYRPPALWLPVMPPIDPDIWVSKALLIFTVCPSFPKQRREVGERTARGALEGRSRARSRCLMWRGSETFSWRRRPPTGALRRRRRPGRILSRGSPSNCLAIFVWRQPGDFGPRPLRRWG